MSIHLTGLGCITPLGATPAEVWRRLAAGEHAAIEELVNPETGRRHPAARVPAALTAHLAREPRLRRASTISLLAAAAGRAAMEQGAPTMTAAEKSRLALVFAVSSGGVQYTRRFYEQVVKQGANAASPMLFPETVYNAPASHLAALLGVDGATYTVVGDGTVGLQALRFATQLLDLRDADHVLVVAAEELDWILLEAHRAWRLTTGGQSSPGALLAEAAAAVLLTRRADSAAASENKTAPAEIPPSHPAEPSALGNPKSPTSPTGQTCPTSPSPPIRLVAQSSRTFHTRAGAHRAMTETLREISPAGPADIVLGGANGTWVDPIIEQAVRSETQTAALHSPKLQLGEALGAAALLQVVLAAQAMTEAPYSRALIASLGWNQQAAAAVLERVEEK